MIEQAMGGREGTMSGIHRGVVFEQIDRLYRAGTLAGHGDAELLERYLTHHDEAAFETLVNVHGPMVLGLCRRLLRDPKDIEDAFQATFLVLVRKAPAIQDRDLLANWLYGVAYRVASRARSDVLRRRGRESAVANLEAPVDVAAESMDIAEIAPVLDRELNRLPRKYRTALVACYLGGQTHEQTAKALGCPLGTVRSRVARGRDMLRKRLTRLGYAPSAILLGPAGGLPTKLLTESVPPALVSATVRAGLAVGSFKTIQAGAVGATALALTQGVLTTMKLTQLKWIGLALLATTCSAGGVIAVSYASAQVAKEQAGAAAGARPEREATSGDSGTVLTEAVIERKIEQLLGDIGYYGDSGYIGPDGEFHGNGQNRALALKILERKLGPLLRAPEGSAPGGGGVATVKSTTRSVNVTRSAPATAPVARGGEGVNSTVSSSGSGGATSPAAGYAHPVSLGAARQDAHVPDSGDVARRSIHEIDMDLKHAIRTFERVQALFQQNSVPKFVVEDAQGKVLHLIGVLEGLQDDLSDENEQLQLEEKKKQAELSQIAARRESASTRVKLNQEASQTGRASSLDVQNALADLKEADALVRVKEIEVELVQLRAAQLKRRLRQASEAVELARPFKNAGPR
jgi:RNA polymerase sigma factor (sigma-70 family)